MAHPEGVNTVEGRLATFNAAHPAKRRASTTRKRAAATLAWPHDSPTPDDLARAGFYFAPSASSPDNTRCHSCDVQLDGWETGDDPVAEHYAHKPDCAWAITCYVRKTFNSGETIDEDPMSEKFREARIGTFRDSWPHENKRAWKCKVSKLVDAGWYFDPAEEAEDAVSCAYCNLSIAGWEPKDDPTKEHKKRDADCPFFLLSEKFAATRPPKGKKSRVSRQSKIDRTSLQSTATLPIEVISMTGPEEDDTNDTVLTTTSVATTASKATKSRATKGRGRKKVAAIEDNFENETPSQDTAAEAAPARRTKRQASRQVSRTTKKTPSEEIVDSTVQKLTRGTKRTSDGSIKEDSTVNTTVIHCVEPSQPSRGTKRTSDGTLKSETAIAETVAVTNQQTLDSSVIILEDPPSSHTNQEQRPKRAKRTKKVATDVLPSDSEVPSKPAPKSKKAKKAPSRPPLADLEPDVVQKETEAHKLRSSGVNFADTIASTPKRDTPEISPDALSSAPSTPTPARSALPSGKRKSMQSKSSLTPKVAAKKTTSPAESPQTSDAENKPPSARPSIRGLVLQPISPLRAPIHATPKLSPSRNNIVGRLRTQYSWEAADLDAIFASHSPKKNVDENANNKENDLASLDLNNLDKKGLSDIVKAVKSHMTDSERKMTVEQWVRWNAQKSEEKLKAECETMVTIFEREGAKAQRALEGIQHRE